MIAGVDGCRGGWFAVLWNGEADGVPTGRIFPNFSSILDLPADIIAVDIPIGFPVRASYGGRPACVEARARLGGRQSSVFSVPSRAAVMCADYREACAVNLENSDPPRKVSKQCFNLFPKMREVDGLLTPQLQSRVFEVHPELAFCAMNGQAPLDQPKKVKSRPYEPGLSLRKQLLQIAGFPINDMAPVTISSRQAGEDDLVDAAALCWSALRILQHRQITLPSNPPRDERGLRMEINA